MENKAEEGLRLLALDGGGIHGLSELLILEEIMRRIKDEERLKELPKPCEYFDIIGGTNTGGLIAILLGRLCMSVDEAINVYNEFAGKVFSERKYCWQDGTFKASTLEAAVKKIVARFDKSGDDNMMSEMSKRSACKTFVCAMSAQNMAHPRLFRSYEVRSNAEYNAKIWEVARATSAAPRFFKCIKVGAEPKEEFVDGGLMCNNPTAEVLREAQNTYGIDHPIACIVSIGSGHPRTITLRKPDWFQRLLPTKLIKVLVAIATNCEKESENFERTHGEGNKNRSGGEAKKYFRFNVQQGLQDVSLAEWTKMGEVKTHTLQYLRGAAVDVEINRVRDVLRARRTQMLVESLT
ncbi:Calcium-independent phospholipase A2-gamma [Termitomyces sp. T112]|nr:Calcium-independent phospholipase A2-gamma [Termitomyces sp. T112]